MTDGYDVPDFDVHAPLMSLPAILGTTLATLPKTVPYLSADRGIIEKWRPIVAKSLLRDNGRRAPQLRIGIAWQGNPLNRVDRWRSYPLAQLAPLASVPGVALMSLQRGDGTDQLQELAGRFSVAELKGGRQSVDDDRDFLDTAAVMSQLDLVVTPETAVAHLAGSLGVPVWVALSHISDWRWQLERDRSPWYPTMRLFRQSTAGNWDEVFRQMANALNQQLAERGSLISR